ncbi:hypothetical protein BDP67DRAFT_277162 [Colletotrichum lupini]|nr:hypothetical protein BDP67DRAFT_277162 [Colletotrichum lupini]
MARWPSGLRRQLQVKSDPAGVETRASSNLVLVIILLFRDGLVGFCPMKVWSSRTTVHGDEMGGFVMRMAPTLNRDENAMHAQRGKAAIHDAFLGYIECCLGVLTYDRGRNERHLARTGCPFNTICPEPIACVITPLLLYVKKIWRAPSSKLCIHLGALARRTANSRPSLFLVLDLVFVSGLHFQPEREHDREDDAASRFPDTPSLALSLGEGDLG